jgi:hypothetical protein
MFTTAMRVFAQFLPRVVILCHHILLSVVPNHCCMVHACSIRRDSNSFDNLSDSERREWDIILFVLSVNSCSTISRLFAQIRQLCIPFHEFLFPRVLKFSESIRSSPLPFGPKECWKLSIPLKTPPSCEQNQIAHSTMPLSASQFHRHVLAKCVQSLHLSCRTLHAHK